MTAPAAVKPRKTAPRWLVFVLAGATLFGFIGCTVGATAAGSAKVSREAVMVEVTPQACMDALASADQGFTLASEAMGFASDGFYAQAEFDVAAMQIALEGIESTNAQIGAVGDSYRAASAACRAGGE